MGTALGGMGFGSIAYQAVLGLRSRGMLALGAALSAARPLPAGGSFALYPYLRMVRSRRLQWALFDRLVSRRLRGGVFYGWAGYSLHSLRLARRRGMVTLLDRNSTEVRHQAAVLEREHRLWGLSGRGVPKWVIDRMVAEYDNCDYIVVPSEVARESFLRAGYPPQGVLVLPLGVDVESYAPMERVPEGRFELLFVGQVCARKGVQHLLTAWGRLQPRGGVLRLVGPVRREYRSLVAALVRECPTGSVVLEGSVADPRPFYRQASVFVLPSLEEGSALVTYEAMASGLPCIVTPESGSVVRDGLEGIMVPAGDPAALGQAIGALQADPALRATMGRSARERAMGYTWERYQEGLACILGDAMERRREQGRAGD